MKILQVVHSLPSFSQGGTEIYAFDSASELSKKHQVYIFSRYSDLKQADYFVRKEIISGINVYLINNTFRDYDSFELSYQNPNIDKKFAQLLDEIKPDIVHIHHLAFLSLGIIEKAKERDIPLIFTLHDYWLACPKWHLLKAGQFPCEKAAAGLFGEECGSCLRDILKIKPGAVMAYYWLKKLLPGYLLKYLIKAYFHFSNAPSLDAAGQLKKRAVRARAAIENIDLFISPSQYVKDQFIRFGIDPGKILLYYPSLNMPKARTVQGKSAGKICFAFAGTIIPAKGLHVLIEAFNGIKSDIAVLKIYGKLKDYPGFEGYLRSLKRSVRNKFIKFIGEFRHEEIGEVLDSVDVLIVPSVWQENSPLIIRESFLLKIPVIASRAGGIPELINDGINGFLFEPGNAGELQEKLEYVINNPGVLGRLKENMAQARPPEDSLNEIENIYRSLIKTNEKVYAA